MRSNPHSYSDTASAQTRSIDLTLRADFDRRVLEGEECRLHFRAPGSGPLDLDTRDLRIRRAVTCSTGPRSATISLRRADPGARLADRSSAGRRGRSASATRPPRRHRAGSARAVANGGSQPFLFSQAQPIHARIPWRRCRNTRAYRHGRPRRASRFPRPLARADGAAAKGPDVFESRRPFPAYLLAFAVGRPHLAPPSPAARQSGRSGRSRGTPRPRSSARSSMDASSLRRGAVRARTSGIGCDILVMPPSFPYGGMENPRLTFVTLRSSPATVRS